MSISKPTKSGKLKVHNSSNVKSVPFTNNFAERGLRQLKTKLKIIGCFRTLSGTQDYCNAKSIIDTSRKQGVNIGKTMIELMSGNSKVYPFRK